MVTIPNRSRAPHCIGILGGGQLGLMLSQALVALGAEVQIFDPSPDSPAARLTPYWKQIAFDDPQALRDAFASCDRITYEFEHIPTAALHAVTTESGWTDKLWPSLSVLENAQNRVAEKKALTAAGAAVAAWQEITHAEELLAVFKEHSAKPNKFVLKTARGGYDGKGQWRLSDTPSWHACLDELATQPQAFPLVLEEECELDMEVSVIVGRHPKIGAYTFPVVENRHIKGILDTTFSPPQLSNELCTEASAVAQSIATRWDVRGLLTVEFFVVRTPSGKKLLVNEVAPRPHNSGHITRCSMTRSQFDILAQILLDLPFSSAPTAASKSWCMWNTLGDLWTDAGLTQMGWNDAILGSHHLCEAMLYGKPEARPRRKMGHVILTADDRPTLENAIENFRTSFHTHQKGFR